MKGGIRILSLDDSPFKRSDKENLIVGVVSRNEIVEGILSFYVHVNGDDATEQLIKKIEKSRFRREIKLIVLNGITFAGLNIIDITSVSTRLNVPVLALTRRKPNRTTIKNAINSLGKNSKLKLAILKRIIKLSKSSRSCNMYAQYINMQENELEKFIKISYPMLRLAHLIASGVVRGESRGRI
ncbi:MAG: DUF99 family protein [Candidatus Micrarchaeia archaeon]